MGNRGQLARADYQRHERRGNHTQVVVTLRLVWETCVLESPGRAILELLKKGQLQSAVLLQVVRA